MRRKTVTIRDVAQRAQVSVSTVSQVLNGNHSYVSADKRERVLQAAEELQYRPNAIARSMVKQRTGTVGMIFTSVVDHLFIHTIKSAQAVLRPEGYTIFLADTPDIKSEIQAIAALQDRQVDGFIFVSMTSVADSAHLQRLKEEEVPFVVINRPRVQAYDFNQIQWNDWEAGYLATRHLLNLGHTSITTISGPLQGEPHWQSASDRLEGWQQALAEQGITASPDWVFDGNYTCQGGYEATIQLLKQAGSKSKLPTALFVANEEMSIGVLRALHYAGVRVPQDIALVNVGDTSFTAHMTPALTTLAHPVAEAGQIAAQILLKQFAVKELLPAQKVMLSFAMRIRESCGSNPEPSELFF
ncbi:LacI family transcriptional regulator [Ktedonobacter sp. SOSP1-85]|uniref:LacI family DNA-binding transcriptional regulator n=1 Tax=Ktedonobacter sp. SOSP1-85 TaxID=2778367 RepID=UPI0019152D41|nr:LacI family DNA-binding transcriptional regulator [Ktedonobacter sp. SOSP1-85]GHO78850.1 LacI family transcriptional regulator [Ktedonobacter sp. SOSP1-85]